MSDPFVIEVDLNGPKPEKPFPGGLYKHFKGGLYRVLYIAKDSDTLEDVVVYTNEIKGFVWTRKLSDWMSLKDGKIRFQRFMQQ
jgi:hypothetical protein